MKHEKVEILNYLHSHKEYYRTNFNVVKIGVFGSYSRDSQTDDSDIDIIFEFGEKTTNLFDKKYELNSLFCKIQHFYSPELTEIHLLPQFHQRVHPPLSNV
jgi:hypothetical protein